MDWLIYKRLAALRPVKFACQSARSDTYAILLVAQPPPAHPVTKAQEFWRGYYVLACLPTPIAAKLVTTNT